ncbi:MAG: hypothetical protein ACXWNQ_06165 [Anaerolineales bacterium]
MFDNLRDQANSTPFYEDETQFRESEGMSAPPPPAKPTNLRFMGMTPPQRFIVAVMFLISICVLGTMLLLLTGRISLI